MKSGVVVAPFCVPRTFRPVCCLDIQLVKVDISSLAASTKGCVDFKRGVCSCSEQVIFLWSRCRSYSETRRARNNVTCLRRGSAGRIPAITGRYSVDAGRRHMDTTRNVLLVIESIRQV